MEACAKIHAPRETHGGRTSERRLQERDPPHIGHDGGQENAQAHVRAPPRSVFTWIKETYVTMMIRQSHPKVKIRREIYEEQLF